MIRDRRLYRTNFSLLTKIGGYSNVLFIMLGYRRILLDTWDDKQSGQKRSRLRVVAENIQLLGARQEGEAPGSTTSARGRSSKNASVPDKDLRRDAEDEPF
jgi:hypothetical protein